MIVPLRIGDFGLRIGLPIALIVQSANQSANQSVNQSAIRNPQSAIHLLSPNALVGFELARDEANRLAAFARRRGTVRFVAAVNGPTARTARVDFAFLDAARYDALLVRDDLDNPAAVRIEQAVTKGGTLAVDMRAAGGFVARLTPRHSGH